MLISHDTPASSAGLVPPATVSLIVEPFHTFYSRLPSLVSAREGCPERFHFSRDGCDGLVYPHIHVRLCSGLRHRK